MLNATLEFRPTEHLGIEVWGNNLTDKHYYIPGQASTTVDTGQLAAPRTYGMNFKFDF